MQPATEHSMVDPSFTTTHHLHATKISIHTILQRRIQDFNLGRRELRPEGPRAGLQFLRSLGERCKLHQCGPGPANGFTIF